MNRKRPSTLIKCDTCGKEFLKENYKIKLTKRHFCSKACVKPVKGAGKPTEMWQRIKKEEW